MIRFFRTLKLSLLLSFATASWAQGKDEPVSFENDVLPIFMRAGCNAGDCHGAARGKDGFMLSLFGYDPEGDYYRLMEEYIGRRVNLGAPEKSLLLQKSIGEVHHTGGELFTKDSESYEIIHRWIAQGAPRDDESTPEATGIRVEPAVIEFDAPKAKKPTKVIATYSDGSERDVTRWSLFLSSNDGVVGIDDDGMVSATRAGGAHVFARFNRFTQGSEVFVLPGDEKFEWSPPKANNYIDELVYDKLEKLRIHPSELSSDEDFLRRVTIDLTGLLPTPTEYEDFISSEDPNKRAKVIEDLLQRDDFAHLWAAKWGEWVRIKGDTNPGSGNAMKAAWGFYYWILDEIVNDRPIDELLYAMLTGTGSNLRQPPSNFYTMIPSAGQINPSILSQDVAQLTMGIRMQCAECHNHPFDRWTMDDYYGWTSFFTGIERKRGREAREMLISVNVEAAPAKHLLDDRPMPPRFLGGEAPDTTDKDPRQLMAAWLTAEDNTLFRRHMANRVWEHFFGRGIVEPIDDVRISNPASNEPLLEELGRRFAEDHDYRLRDLVRDICDSTTYQLSAGTNASNEDDEEFFSHAALRRPRADVLLDCINQALDNTPTFRRSTKTRAIDLFQGGATTNEAYFFSTFGQSKRASICACETSTDAQLAQSLHLINGETIQKPLRASALVNQLTGSHPDQPELIIEQLFIRLLTRKPSADELKVILSNFPEKTDQKSLKIFYDGVLWGLLNSSEFLYNH
ncbi:MAG: DUF1549 domain-containing protein [Verrucomicrobiales bacterium]|nr:DUF1549 domain-containing protein [Verrucomicrobiales bacterium]